MHYKDKDWLETQYATRSTFEIAKDEKVNPETIRLWLKRFGIERRDAVTLNYLETSSALVEFMTGSMLGDGSLVWGHRGISAYLSIGSSRREYLVWLEKRLFEVGILPRGTINFCPRGSYPYWQLQSKYYRSSLPDLRMLWYPDEKKALPSGVRLTRYSLMIFYIEDGSLSITPAQKQICIAMNSFRLEEARNIKDQICHLIGSERVYARDSGTGPCIWISSKAAIQAFFDFIGPCPSELEGIFGHKWW